jgi:hypothetical protein
MIAWYKKQKVTIQNAIIVGIFSIIGAIIYGIFGLFIAIIPNTTYVKIENTGSTFVPSLNIPNDIDNSLVQTFPEPDFVLTPSLTPTLRHTITVTQTPSVISTPEFTSTPIINEYCARYSIVRVRTGPGIFYTQLSVLKHGECFLFDARTSDGAWMRIHDYQGNNSGGWVSSDQVQPKSIEDLPTTSPAPIYCRIYKVNTYLNVRDGPGDNTIIGYLHTGNVLLFDARNQEGTWIRIADDQEPYNFTDGWISTKYAIPFNIDDNVEWSISLFYDLPIISP